MDIEQIAEEFRKFRAEHFWEIPEGTSETTRRFHPPEDILDRLRERYTGDEVPRCRVLVDGQPCGAELSPQSMGGGNATKYAHSTPDGVRMGDWMEHYRDSQFIHAKPGDSEVVALLDLIDRIRKGS